MNNATEAFREAVVNWLKATGSKVDDLALTIGCSASTLQKFVNRDTTNITLQRAIDISKIIGYELEV